jgi:hypothetical protein
MAFKGPTSKILYLRLIEALREQMQQEAKIGRADIIGDDWH